MTGERIGNFPQAFTHLPLIDTATAGNGQVATGSPAVPTPATPG